MRKLATMVLAVVLSAGFLAGCKADPVPDPVPSEPPIPQYWVVEGMTLEGTEFTSEDIESIFGPRENVMVLALDDNQVLKGVFFEDYLETFYEGTRSAFSFELMGQKGQGVINDDGLLELTLDDGSRYVFVGQDEMPASLANNAWATYSVNFSAEETCAMSNFMSAGMYLVEDGVLYGLTNEGYQEGALAARPFSMKGDFPEFGEATVLDGSGFACFLSRHEDYLYYISDYSRVCRAHLDGTGLETLYDGTCDYLQIHEGRLYFCDADYRFVSTDMDGGDLRVVLDKEVYYPYFIAQDWLIFQDDADDESLHICNVAHGTEANVTYMPTYSPVVDGSSLYCLGLTDSSHYLLKIDMTDPQVFRTEASEKEIVGGVFLIDDVSIYAPNDMSVPKEEWDTLESTDSVMSVLEKYVSVDYRVHHELDEDGYIVAKYLMSKERHGGTSFA